MRFIILLLLFATNCASEAQTDLHHRLYKAYPKFKEKTIKDRRFKHADIVAVTDRFKNRDWIKVSTVGTSVEGRSINLLSMGKGPVQVLLWSQMHGDEPTATMALMDVLNFFSEAEGEMAGLRDRIFEKLSIHMLPMLNPDGAERFQRRNALGVDLNRDALRLQNPETRTLKRIRDSLEADWGFNLHDQSRFYGAGYSDHVASISFLAPAYNFEKSVNDVRKKSMQLIVNMNKMLQDYIPNKVARYSDDFEPRAFGDNMQKWGTSTILIESGGLEGDREKQELRRLHFMILLGAFASIADGNFQAVPTNAYNEIPFNKSNLFHDLILREVQVGRAEDQFTLDLAFRFREVEDEQHRSFYLDSSIRDIGDLSTTKAYKEYDMSSYRAEPGKVYPKTLKDWAALKKLNLPGLLAKGYTMYRLQELPKVEQWREKPYVLLRPGEDPELEIDLGANPSLLFIEDFKVQKVLINGVVYDLKKDKEVLRF